MMFFLTLSTTPCPGALALGLVALFVLYGISLVLCRLYLSPLSRFPGPNLAAATYWYEFYYDVWLRGQYTFKIIELHKQYGPIIRINPFELHVADPSFTDEIYASGARKRDRSAWFTRQFGPSPCILSTGPHDLHRQRRSVLAPFFSRQRIRALQARCVDAKIEQLAARLLLLTSKGDDPPITTTISGVPEAHVVHLNAAFAAFANDVVTEYTFGTSHDRLGQEGFDPAFHDVMEEGLQSSNVMKHFPWLQGVVHSVPTRLMLWLQPSYGTYLEMRQSVEDEVIHVMKTYCGPSSSDSADGKAGETTIPDPGVLDEHTIFRGVLDSKLPPGEKTLARMTADAGTIMVAGTLTTTFYLALATYHLLARPCVLRRLKEELRAALGPPVPPEEAVGGGERENERPGVRLEELERLPYLTAVIQEAFRMSYGSSSRLQRAATGEELVYRDDKAGKEWVIPRGTPVGMTAVQIHNDPELFGEDTHVFRPSRFLENPASARHLLHFSKGSRICLGQNLALAEFYYLLARLWNMFGSPEVRLEGDLGYLELYETEEADVKVCADFNFPGVKEGSRGVRVKVHTY